jgi:hypothetical protein
MTIKNRAVEHFHQFRSPESLITLIKTLCDQQQTSSTMLNHSRQTKQSINSDKFHVPHHIVFPTPSQDRWLCGGLFVNKIILIYSKTNRSPLKTWKSMIFWEQKTMFDNKLLKKLRVLLYKHQRPSPEILRVAEFAKHDRNKWLHFCRSPKMINCCRCRKKVCKLIMNDDYSEWHARLFRVAYEFLSDYLSLAVQSRDKLKRSTPSRFFPC